mmetsp:Transcript_26163/g.57919  ORF Transcript_26163/g.57919 Transcript_26163/m.57919 type:complete len:223 (-) Transcript_26163:240-908(-)
MFLGTGGALNSTPEASSLSSTKASAETTLLIACLPSSTKRKALGVTLNAFILSGYSASSCRKSEKGSSSVGAWLKCFRYRRPATSRKSSTGMERGLLAAARRRKNISASISLRGLFGARFLSSAPGLRKREPLSPLALLRTPFSSRKARAASFCGREGFRFGLPASLGLLALGCTTTTSVCFPAAEDASSNRDLDSAPPPVTALRGRVFKPPHLLATAAVWL